MNISILKMSWPEYGGLLCHSSCVWQWLAGVGAGAPREGLFVQDEVDSTSRVATFVRADRLEKIIMLANIRDGKKWVI